MNENENPISIAFIFWVPSSFVLSLFACFVFGCQIEFKIAGIMVNMAYTIVLTTVDTWCHH